MDKELGQLFHIGVQGTELTNDEIDFITKNNIGGVTLFARNLENPEQIHKLCTSIQSLHKKQEDQAPLFIGIDMEGGRVHRLEAPFTQWPSMEKLGNLDSTAVAFRFASSMGAELTSVGINLNFSPCVDVNTNPENPIIADRAFGADPNHVAKMASAVTRGFIKSGIVPCAKHFPGHGNTTVDSHLDLPVENTDMATLEGRELIPFKKSFRARMDLVMTAHISFPKVDEHWPVTLSEKFLKEILREKMRYRNIVITDDLGMKALANYGTEEEIAVRALQAGNDILLYCNEFDVPPRTLEACKVAIREGKVTKESIKDSYNKIIALKKAKLGEAVTPSFDEAKKIIAHPDHMRLAQSIDEGQIPDDLKTT